MIARTVSAVAALALIGSLSACGSSSAQASGATTQCGEPGSAVTSAVNGFLGVSGTLDNGQAESSTSRPGAWYVIGDVKPATGGKDLRVIFALDTTGKVAGALDFADSAELPIKRIPLASDTYFIGDAKSC